MSGLRASISVLATVLVATLLAASASLLIYEGWYARHTPDLRVWHRLVLEHEFRAGRVDTFTGYLELERRLFDELDRKLRTRTQVEGPERYNRYAAGLAEPLSEDLQRWNRSVVLEPPGKPRGGILLLHGLADSPYILRSVAQRLRARGLYVLILRLPGAGTVPSEMRSIEREDWSAAVDLAAAHVKSRIDGAPFSIGGYSNGGSLALVHALQQVVDGSATRPERIYLWAPAIAVTPFAPAAGLKAAIGRLPFMEKAAWGTIRPEYDPFRYNSFPIAAGYQVYRVGREVQGLIDDLAATGRIDEIPPILAFQSVVDASLREEALVHGLFNRLSDGGHELVLFDVNRMSVFAPFFRAEHRQLVAGLEARSRLPYDFTLVSNSGPDSSEVTAYRRPKGQSVSEAVPLDRAWPEGVLSLSHMALPIAYDDPVYADDAASPLFHARAPRGERNMLVVPERDLLQQRYNPFFDYMSERMLEFCEPCASD